jgi:anti-sigma B factor antagonist
VSASPEWRGEMLVLSGEIDVAAAPNLRDTLAGGSDLETTLVVDLSEVAFIDSTGLGVLVDALRRRQRAGGDLMLVIDNPSVRRLFEMTGLDTVFTIQENVFVGQATVAADPAPPVMSEREECIELTIPADPGFIGIARLVAGTVASRIGFDIEEIDDLRLAVDELLVPIRTLGADGRAHLQCRGIGDSVHISCRFEGNGPGPAESPPVDPTSLSQLLLDALVDRHGSGTRDGDEVRWLVKAKGSPAGDA